MTQLNCSVESCLHFSDNYCCKGRIVVEGEKASNVGSTCCGSFDERTRDSFRNRFETPQTKIEVECEAEKCIFNEEHYCNADHIGISGNGANRSVETECASFRLKD